MSEPVTVVAKLVAQPGQEEAFLVELRKAVEATRAEAGCIAYDPHQDLADPAVFWMVEKWESAEALGAHSQSEHLKAFGAAVRSIAAARPEVHVTRAIS